ncbi:MAG: type III-A CRISPR-associated RAMP protein Csm3 [Bacteroidia bacterium]
MAPKFTGKLFITGKIRAVTGLHIGGSKAALDIGGIDLNVIKTAIGKVPFIPGSSLKGKLRTLLAREVGSIAVSAKQLKGAPGIHDMSPEAIYISEIFGFPGDAENETEVPTRLLVRDAFLDTYGFEKTFSEADLTDEYTEEKWENTINRRTGTAEHPRQLERVPAGADFDFVMIYNVYDDGKKDAHIKHIRRAMRILEEDYLGGQGSRGYGAIEFVDVELSERTVEDYEANNSRKVVEADFLGKKAKTS